MTTTRMLLEHQILRLRSQISDLEATRRPVPSEYWAHPRINQHFETQVYDFDSVYTYTIERSIRGPTRLRFGLFNSSHMPSSQEGFLQTVRRAIAVADETDGYVTTGLTFGLISSRNRTTFLSVPKRDIIESGWDWVIQKISEAESGQSFDIFEGYGDIADMMVSCALDFRVFTLNVSRLPAGGCSNASNIHVFYDTISEPSANNNCLIRCVAKCLGVSTPPAVIRVNARLQDGPIFIHDIYKIEKYFCTTIDVYDDVIDLTISAADKGTGRIDDYVVHVDTETPRLLYGSGSSAIKLLLTDGHYSTIVRKRDPSEYMCKHTGRILLPGDKLSDDDIRTELILQGRMNSYRKGRSNPSKRRYFFFDFETVWDQDSLEMMPYAYSIVVVDNIGNILDRRFRMGNPDEHDLEKDIIDYLILHAPNVKGEVHYLIGFNNSKFDNYILLNAASKHDAWHKGEVFAMNSIIYMCLLGFQVKDLSKFVRGSLKAACNNFGCIKVKDELNHDEVQSAYLDKRLTAYLTDKWQDIFEYSIRDVECLSELYFKTRSSLMVAVKLDIDCEITLPSMMYKRLKEDLKQVGVDNMPILDYKTDSAIRKAIIGGRAQIFDPICTNEVVVIDKVSHYPSVMMDCSFPVGDYIRTNVYVPGRIGVYSVTIPTQPQDNIVPVRISGKPLDWRSKTPLKCCITNVEIGQLISHGCKPDIHDGIYWPVSRKDIFKKTMSRLVKMKEQQDAWKQTNDKMYNASLREVLKILTVSISGKLAERVHKTKKAIIRGSRDKLAFISSVESGSEIMHYYGNLLIAQGKTLDPKPTAPTIWGMLVYAYGRREMYDSVISKVQNKYVTDTDSLVMHVNEYAMLRKNNPDIFGNECGKFKVEMCPSDIDQDHSGPYCIPVSAKCYCIYKINKHTEQRIPIKMAFKGINVSRDKVITDSELIDRIVNKIPRPDNVTAQEYHNIYYYDYLLHGSGTVSVETYMMLHMGQTVYILCAMISRDFLPSRDNPLTLTAEFRLQAITIGSSF